MHWQNLGEKLRNKNEQKSKPNQKTQQLSTLIGMPTSESLIFPLEEDLAINQYTSSRRKHLK